MSTLALTKVKENLHKFVDSIEHPKDIMHIANLINEMKSEISKMSFDNVVKVLEKETALSTQFELYQAGLKAKQVSQFDPDYPMVKASNFCHAIGFNGTNPSRFANNMINKGLAISVKDGQYARYPIFQIDMENVCVYPIVADIIELLDFFSDRALYAWFCTEHPSIGCTPADALSDQSLHLKILSVANNRRHMGA